MSEILYTISVLIHVLFAVVAVGTVSVVDYLHLVGLRRKGMESRLVRIYPLLTRMINYALIGIYVTGILIVWQNPALLSSSIFQLKISMVVIVTINGIFLQKKVGPELDKCILDGKKYCTQETLFKSVFAGSISIVTWYAILILAFSKSLGYSVLNFVGVYLIVLFLAMIVAYSFERKARQWRE